MDPIARQIYRAADLRALGLTRHVVRAQLADGRLQRYAPGLFFVPLQDADERERWLQSAQLHLLTLGPDAMLARSSAAALFDLDGFDRPGTVVECNTAVRSGGARPRRASRRTVPLEPPDRVDGLAVTTIGQTLVELGSTVARSALSPVDRVELALECALHRHLTTLNALSALAEHAGRRRGAAILREALARRPPDAAPTESYLETRMVQLLRHHRLPVPLRQVELHDRFGFIGRVDLVIDNVAIELHGGLHNVSQAIDADRLRRDRLEAAGYRVLEFSYHQVIDEPQLVAAIVRATLARAA